MKIFENVIALSESRLNEGQLVKVKKIGEYLIKSSGLGVTLANGKIAIPIPSGGSINVKQFGAVGNGVVDDTEAFKNAINVSGNIFIPNGVYLIDPSGSFYIPNGAVIKGESKMSTQLLAKQNVAGSVLKREFNPSGTNDYIQYACISNLTVYLNHLHQSTEPTNLQIGIDLSNITRSKVYNCYVGNVKRGIASSLYPNSTKQQMARGYGIVVGNVSGSDPAYAGGEVNEIVGCNVVSAEYGIGGDLIALTGGASASYATKILRNDIQSCRIGIAQESQYGAGNSIIDNVVQDAILPSGSVKPRYLISFRGYNSTIGGGYFESVDSSINYGIYMESNSDRNNIKHIQHGYTLDKFINDNGQNNVIDTFVNTGGSVFKNYRGINQNEVQYVKAKVTFDSSGTILESLNIASVGKNATGDFNINWDSSVVNGDVVNIQVQQESSASREPRVQAITHSGSTTRLESYSQQGGIQTKSDAVTYYVTAY